MKNITSPFGYGALPSSKDSRDIKDPNITLASPYPDKYETDMSVFQARGLFERRYQKKLGVCVACAVVTYVEWLYFQKTGKYVELSVAFAYLVIKKLIDRNTIEGTSLRSALKLAMKYGICSEATFPTDYDLTHSEFLAQVIPEAAWSEALNYTIGGYVSIPIDRSLLAAGIYKYGMLMTRMEVGDTWWIPSWLAKDILPLKKPKSIVSGHAVDDHKYDVSLMNKAQFSFINWWSPTWGRGGVGEFIVEEYPPTEAWALTLESVMQYQDHSPTLAESVWRKVMEVLRTIGMIK